MRPRNCASTFPSSARDYRPRPSGRFGTPQLRALQQFSCDTQLAVVPGATRLFVEPGALAQVASLAAAWFSRHAMLQTQRSPVPIRRNDGISRATRT